jgi:hypothetical protein
MTWAHNVSHSSFRCDFKATEASERKPEGIVHTVQTIPDEAPAESEEEIGETVLQNQVAKESLQPIPNERGTRERKWKGGSALTSAIRFLFAYNRRRQPSVKQKKRTQSALPNNR